MQVLVRYLSDFVYLYPLIMSIAWMIGGIIFYIRRERGQGVSKPNEAGPFFSILVPCHNEEQQIEKTTQHLLELNYENYEIILIDDGSTDNTTTIINNLCHRHRRVRGLYLTVNQGKANALNVGCLAARGELILSLDADALLDPNAIGYMAWHFEKFPRVGAVTGNPRVLNRTTLLGKIQVGEFATIIGLIKRSQRLLGKVLTVSGVIAAFRRSALLSAGFWDTDMATEDIDITWKLEKKFWDIRYEPRAICWILVPETLKGLWRQRLRWAQGGIEVVRKHWGIWKSWQQRRLWPVYIEFMISLVWSHTFWALMLLWLGQAVFGLYPSLKLVPFIPPRWTGAVLAIACLFQFTVSLILDHHYEKKMFRYGFWVIELMIQ